MVGLDIDSDIDEHNTQKEIMEIAISKKIEPSEPFDISTNSMLSPALQERKTYPYYAEFFVLPNFDDSWKSLIYADFLQFCNDYKHKNINLTLQDNTMSLDGDLRLTITTKGKTEKVQEDILTLTRKIQKDFLLTPIVEKISYGFSNEKDFPVHIQEPEKSHYSYNRFNLQKQVAQILDIKNKTGQRAYTIQYLENIEHQNDEIAQAQLEALRSAESLFHMQIEQLEKEKHALIRILYIQESFGDLGIIEENINTPFSPELLSITNNITQLETPTDEEIIEEVDGEAHYGIIEQYKTNNDGDLIRGNIIGSDQNFGPSNDGRIKGFRLEGIREIDRIFNIIENNKGHVESFLIKTNNNLSFFYRKDNSYTVLEIEGISKFKDYYRIKINYGVSGNIVSGEIRKIENDGIIYFYTENDELTFLRIDDTIEFSHRNDFLSSNKTFLKCDETGCLSKGIIAREKENYSFVYNEKGEMKVLEIEGQKNFLCFKEHIHRDISGHWKGSVLFVNKKLQKVVRKFHYEDGEYQFKKKFGFIK